MGPGKYKSRSDLDDAIAGLHETGEILFAAVLTGELGVLAEPGLIRQFEGALDHIHQAEHSLSEPRLVETVRALRADAAALGDVIWPKGGGPIGPSGGSILEERVKRAIVLCLAEVYADMEACLTLLIHMDRRVLGGGGERRQRLKRIATSKSMLQNMKPGDAVKLPASLRIANWLSSIQAWLSGKLAGGR